MHLDHGQLEGGTAEGGSQVGVHGPPHALQDDQVRAHRGVRQAGRNPSQIQAGAALAVVHYVQLGIPARTARDSYRRVVGVRKRRPGGGGGGTFMANKF